MLPNAPPTVSGGIGLSSAIFIIVTRLATTAGVTSLSAAEVRVTYILTRPANSGCIGVFRRAFAKADVDPSPLPTPSYPHTCEARTVPLDEQSLRAFTVYNSYPPPRYGIPLIIG
ncbi:hypothetical protein B0H19DRAFT_1275300 [Mycena capillaripes]|nr:hypothetical protein B0H19DRAFT_1275300 [Mycena capillaripes]